MHDHNHNHSVLVHSCQKDRNTVNAVDDKYFIFGKKSIGVFKKLYDDYEKYLLIYYDKMRYEPKPPSTRPEDIFAYHLNRYGEKITARPVIDFVFSHVCSEFCGHNGPNTQT